MSFWDEPDLLSDNPLDQLAERIRSCQACQLCNSRTQAVPGTGRQDAPIFVIGEKPGKREDQAGIPMLGEGGKLFTSLLQRAGLKRSDCFITNRVKCLPPYKHRLTTQELDACHVYLEEELALVQPKVILCLGNLATSLYWPPTTQSEDNRIGAIQGKPMARFMAWGPTVIYPTYHPASAAWKRDDQDWGGRLVEVITEDLKSVAKILKGMKAHDQR